jgi:general L-amino acid transport system substrate-binding protein
VSPLVIDSAAQVAEAFFAGRCQAYTSDASQLAAVRLRAPGGPHGYVIPITVAQLAISALYVLALTWIGV